MLVGPVLGFRYKWSSIGMDKVTACKEFIGRKQDPVLNCIPIRFR
jgi:hypothetical protein